jgi:radical SAM superfamily enzyme YgiQ (UPF0313 family)
MAAKPETIDLLFKSGLRSAHFGIETFDKDAAKIIGKSGNREKLISTLKYIKNTYGDKIGLNGSFIFGLPGESLSSMQQTAKQLLSKETSLDSWRVYPLHISVSKAFSSDIDVNYEKYGYRKKGVLEKQVIDWENDYTSFTEMSKYVTEVNNEGNPYQGTQNLESFWIAGLGESLDFCRGKYVKIFEWNKVEQLKYHRAKEYKKLMFESMGLDFKITVPYLKGRNYD